MNVMIYVTNNDADRIFYDASPEYEVLKRRMMNAKGKKRLKLKNRLKSKKKNTRILVGGKLFTGNRLRKRDEEAKRENKNDRKVKVRFLVSGHWRKQACGPDQKDRKILWIAPYWKGPELAPLTQRKREVV